MCGSGGDILLPRLLVVVWGLLLYHVLLMLVQVSDATFITWYKVKVSQTTLLQSNKILELENVNIFRSAAIGNRNMDTHQLICCTDTGTCSFYHIIVVAGHDDSASGPVDQCYTIWYPSPSEYQSEGRTFLDTFHIDDSKVMV
ncbi:hypothetical protein Pmani_016404 [Petrolisthes manimaculis]|uniref:Uncharacterized protein n=1 Tax=Petrolisthes manimaculis TaxID=1843537 RepID=A0AAE1U4Y0_9EUCA|nr:hypothetical protein Pmani_017954 [Petrolisthes manimaculis]KAK4310489.1 hypothetical protein Pmani_017955 [Petrolisthes manimaculis]KAK4312151.1 hypothetical protein Pmani_016404 [Petrolisthes manimaculis]